MHASTYPFNAFTLPMAVKGNRGAACLAVMKSPGCRLNTLSRIILRAGFALLLLVATTNVYSQLSKSYQEVWPSIDAYLRLNNKWRLYATTALTKLEESSYADGAIGIFADHFTDPPGFVQKWAPKRVDSLPGKYLWLRFGYQYSATPPSSEDPFKENMLVTEANARGYLPWQMLLTIKNRFDWRFKEGDFNLRYRPRVTVERDMRTQYLTFTGYALLEYFANFGNSQVNKLRSQIGVELRVMKRVNYEIFWNHQFDHQPEVQAVDAFGMTLKIYMDKQDFKKPLFGKENPFKKKKKKQATSNPAK